MRRLIWTFVVAMAILLVPSADPAGAHAEIREADPEVNGTAPTGQNEITITFITVDPEVPVEIEVLDPDGNDIVTGEPTVVEEAPTGTTVAVAVEPLQEGTHLVSWQAMSTDGDGLSTGTYEFTAEDAGGGLGIWLLWAVALAVPALLLFGPALRRRRNRGR